MNQSKDESDDSNAQDDPRAQEAPLPPNSSEGSGNDSDNAVDNEIEEQALSLDDLGAAYARVAAEHDPDAFALAEEESGENLTGNEDEDEEFEEVGTEEADQAATPETIIEGALFVGHPENKSLSEQRIASLMRDVTPKEVEHLIEQLNLSYKEADQALRIVNDERGYRMTIAPEVEDARKAFLGKVREAKLSQSAIEVLALVAYQPGITSQVVQDQRGQDSGSILNQLVRRQLLKLERVKPESGGKKIPHYYTTERFLRLFGLESVEDLPQVDENFRE